MSECTVFENEHFRYQLITIQCLDEALTVTDSTIFADGASKLLGCTTDPEALAELRIYAQSIIDDGVSLVAIDKKNDKVAGIALNKIFLKDQLFYEVYLNSFKNIKARRMMALRDSGLKLVNLFDVLETECLMELALLGVLPEYRKNGIAKKLCEVTVEIAQKLRNGINIKHSTKNKTLSLNPTPGGVVAKFSSFISQKIGQEVGFTIAVERSNEQWELLGSVIRNDNLVTKSTTIEYIKLK